MRNTLPLCLALLLAAGLAPAAHGSGKVLGNYAYDDSGNVTSIGPAGDGLSNYYHYDSAGRLIRFARRPSVTGTAVLEETYRYDGYGNLLELTTNGVVLPVPVSESTNRLTTATYDAAGNVTQHDGVTYRYDPAGTLTEKESASGGRSFYLYTADDERIAIEEPDGRWRYTLRDFDHKVLREWTAPGWNGTMTWAEDYVYLNGRLAAAVRPSGTRHFHVDHLGTPRLITGPGGEEVASHDYYPFGREITHPGQEVPAERMKFTGHERDFGPSFGSAPLDYMHARYYLPSIGRFLSADPVLSEMSLRMPQSLNRYPYVINSPLNYTDPTGLQPSGGLKCGWKGDIWACEYDAFATRPGTAGGTRGPVFGNPPKHDERHRVKHDLTIPVIWQCVEDVFAPFAIAGGLFASGAVMWTQGQVIVSEGIATPPAAPVLVPLGGLMMVTGVVNMGAGLAVGAKQVIRVYNTANLIAGKFGLPQGPTIQAKFLPYPKGTYLCQH